MFQRFPFFQLIFFQSKKRFPRDAQSIYKNPAVFKVLVGSGVFREAFRTHFGTKLGPFLGPFLDKFRSDLESSFWLVFGTVLGGIGGLFGRPFGTFLVQKLVITCSKTRAWHGVPAGGWPGTENGLERGPCHSEKVKNVGNL